MTMRRKGHNVGESESTHRLQVEAIEVTTNDGNGSICDANQLPGQPVEEGIHSWYVR